ncbi:hypothetical protein JK636_13610 [Clostridium sp. YIM B02515]|uniref:Uncharacterized protein n=1 Tax=Clostridium rhizosphaerae TaxID=2803861 RepID=A0ABS1TBS5_9CLOT|nr:DUF5685 family protein [Clostridium rhizosphaerae]MBL4936795.1 hypothetical protein [Clostridium rhizosphaerae]
MFGYVTPCKMELKVKDFEKFKAYYCGLCRAIKKNFGNVPRLALNYDMTFLAVLLDSLSDEKIKVSRELCAVHPTKKRLILVDNSPLDYAAFCNVLLAYYKLVDDTYDDSSKLSKFYSAILSTYLRKASMKYKEVESQIENSLKELSVLEKNFTNSSLDELSHPFADLTGHILSSYNKNNVENLYWLGYNLGKWIYIIDAFDDLEKDMSSKKFNAINSIFNTTNLPYDEFKTSIEDRVDFTLVNCAEACVNYLKAIPIKKNHELLYNILQFGLMEKMDKVFGRLEISN